MLARLLSLVLYLGFLRLTTLLILLAALLCLLALLVTLALLPGFILAALRILLPGQITLLARLLGLPLCLLALGTLFGLAGVAFRYRGRQRPQGRGQGCGCRGHSRQSLSPGIAVIILRAGRARIDALRTAEPVLPALFAAADHRLQHHGRWWQCGRWYLPGPLVRLGALRHGVAVDQHLGALQFGGAQCMPVALHGASPEEIVTADGRHGGGLVLVAVVVGDVYRVVDHDIVVHLRDVTRARPVDRPEGFARSKRKPAHAGQRCAARADGDVPVDAAGVAADKGDERRGIHRALRQMPWHPGPARADLGPAAIVKRRKSPGGIVHPGPAPGRYPAPVTVAVGRPVRGHGARQPDRAVARVLLPVAIAVELLVADGFARDVARRYRLVLAPVPCRGPGVKAVLKGGARRCRSQIGAAEVALLLIAQGERGAVVAIEHAAARKRNNPRGVAGRIDIDAVVAGLRNDKRQIGRVHLQTLAFKQGAHPQLHAALRQPQLGQVVVHRQKIQAGLIIHAHGGRADVQF